MASSVLSKDYQDRLSVLSQIYDLYDHFISTHDLACQKGCAVCCTANVTLTTLEGRKIITYLVENHQISLLQKIIQNRSKSRFQPGNTINLTAVSIIGPDKLLFGSDFPLLPPSRYFKEMRQGGLTEKEMNGICGQNAQNLLFT